MTEMDLAHEKRVALLTGGGMTGSIFMIALPVITGNALAVVMELTNAFFLGRLGPDALAAVTMSFAVIFFIMTFGSGLAIGTVALVARAYGEKNYRKAAHTGTQSILLGFAVSLVIGTAGFLVSPFLLGLMGAKGEILALANVYLRIIFGGLFLMFFMFQVNAIFQGAGDTLTPMKVGVFAMLLNIALDAILIFGLLGFPRLGVAGAALASLIARTLACALLGRILIRGRHAVRIKLDELSPDVKVMKRIFKVGFPGAVQMMIRSSSFVVLTGLAALFGPIVVAALGVGNRIFSVFLFPGFGFGAAASTLAGQNLGAGKPDRAEKSVLLACLYYVSLILVLAVPLFFLSERAAAVFNSDPDFVRATSDFIRFLTVSAIFLGPGLVFSHALQGAGATIYPMFITAVTLYGVQIPAAWFMAVHLKLGAHGIWMAMLAAHFVNAILMSVVFLRGRWKRKVL